MAESHGPDNHIIYLSGGSGRDKALFAQCVNEFFDVIDNQRYILVKRKGHKGLNGFYAIPNCFAKKKEDAERFEKCMHPYIGNYDCVYTRNEKGRELLLEGRVKALANRARLEYLATPTLVRNASAAKAYAPEVTRLTSALKRSGISAKSKRGVRIENILTTKYKK